MTPSSTAISALTPPFPFLFFSDSPNLQIYLPLTNECGSHAAAVPGTGDLERILSSYLILENLPDLILIQIPHPWVAGLHRLVVPVDPGDP